MATHVAKERSETASDDGAAKRNQCEGIDYLKRLSKLIERGKTVLDVGCGDGLPVDAYLVKQGFAVNGIDASARMIERARKNVPEGFYEVKDMFDLKEGEYCVNGVVSLRATLHIPRKRYSTLLKTFASFMPNGGALLLAMEPRKKEGIEDDGHDGTVLRSHDEADSNTELIESAGFTAIVNDIGGSGDEKYQIILARS
jgi:cyclopropane fatty-acyl-phospholipid synthase-like methyltransferase